MKQMYLLSLLVWGILFWRNALPPEASKPVTQATERRLTSATYNQPPTITEVTLRSSNACNSSYAVANDQITCTFTTSRPYKFTVPPTKPANHNPPAVNTTPESSILLFNPFGDLQHWSCIFSLSDSSIPDQSTITARDILNELFNGSYRYYGVNPSITYYAPLDIDYQYTPVTNHDYLLNIEANHAIELLPPYYYQREQSRFCSISIIDAAGNGPLAITIPLEADDILLYNLNDKEQDILIESEDSISFN